ncbi:MAG: hypothetical protein J0H40_17155 [Rhizobiales bacterium]|nr:hypothetical protein [Hyphomicrobiales bacterium]
MTEIIRGVQHRIKSGLADDRAAIDFARAAKDRSMPLDFGNDKRSALRRNEAKQKTRWVRAGIHNSRFGLTVP